MARGPGTSATGGPFDSATVLAVWRIAQTLPGQNPSLLRVDACGALIRFDLHGNTTSRMGWEIDHRTPVARGGSDELANLQPLQWQNNRGKGDALPGQWTCTVRS